MENPCSDEKIVASQIFEKGLELFAHKLGFMLRYLGFLIPNNDDNSPFFFLLLPRWDSHPKAFFL